MKRSIIIILISALINTIFAQEYSLALPEIPLNVERTKVIRVTDTITVVDTIYKAAIKIPTLSPEEAEKTKREVKGWAFLIVAITAFFIPVIAKASVNSHQKESASTYETPY